MLFVLALIFAAVWAMGLGTNLRLGGVNGHVFLVLALVCLLVHLGLLRKTWRRSEMPQFDQRYRSSLLRRPQSPKKPAA